MKPYEQYKPSGVEWLGDVPAHWEVKRLKFLGEIILGLTYSPDDISTDENDTLVLRSSNVQNGKLVFDDNVFVNKDIPSKMITTQDDILICSRNGSRALIGKCALIEGQAIGQTFGAFMTVFRTPYKRFVYYYLNSDVFKAQLGNFLTSTINQLTTQVLGNLPIALPPLSEQTAIAAFLDERTAYIDRLIEKQQALSAKLSEKRTALITEAVCGRLTPHAHPLKESGIQWLGKVPEGWEVCRLKHILECKKNSIKVGPFGSQIKGDDFISSGVPVYNQRTVLDNDFVNGTAFISEEKFEELSGFEVEPFDILITTRGTIGKIAVVPENCEKGIIHPCIIKFAIDRSKILDKLLIYIFNETNLIYEQFLLASNTTTIPVVYSETLKNVIFALPPLEEQTAIADFLDQETAKIDRLQAKIAESVARLKEYRAALITQVVTGKYRVGG